MMSISHNKKWTVKRAQEFYNIHVWSEGYFGVNEKGHMVAKPDNSTNIDLVEVSKEVRERGLSLPVLIRFPQILQARVQDLNRAFIQAAKKCESQLVHIPLYPIKVNQQRTVIETILASDCHQIGLEVGSKTELLVALGLLGEEQGLLICNGYKDRAYIRIALYAQQMGINVFIVIENLSELTIIREESLALGISPKLGVRVKLNAIAAGNWQNSGGSNAKFGLDARDLLKCLELMKQWECVDWLRLVHFHMGSQISKLEDFTGGLLEAMQIYAAIISHEFKPDHIDVGGGLAVDYASQQDASYFSKTYSIQDYADTVVKTITDFCKSNRIDIPLVFTENGRALTAHHAMLITNVIETDSQNHQPQEISDMQLADQTLADISEKLINGLRGNEPLSESLINAFAIQLKDKFLVGDVNLEQRAWAEALLQQSRSALVKSKQINTGFNDDFDDDKASAVLSMEKYYCNFSVFQSMPDVWGLEQVFPIAPLSRLEEAPSKRTRLHDLTCDSDGQISQYAVDGVMQDYLPLHEVSPNQEYLLGFFLLGAYQEVLGDIHNLFGDTHAINVEQRAQGQLQFTEFEIGDCVNELLACVHLDEEQIIKRCQDRLQRVSVRNVGAKQIFDEIKNALFGYTYLDSIDRPAHRIKR